MIMHMDMRQQTQHTRPVSIMATQTKTTMCYGSKLFFPSFSGRCAAIYNSTIIVSKYALRLRKHN